MKQADQKYSQALVVISVILGNPKGLEDDQQNPSFPVHTPHCVLPTVTHIGAHHLVNFLGIHFCRSLISRNRILFPCHSRAFTDENVSSLAFLSAIDNEIFRLEVHIVN